MTDQILPINEIIKTAKRAGITFGHGNPKSHLAYLTKLRLLPQTIRRKINDKIQGCYPQWVISVVQKIEDLRSQGLTYSQIRFQLHRSDVTTPQTLLESDPGLSPFTPSFPAQARALAGQSSAVSFLLIGLILGYLLARTNNPNLNQSLSTTPPVLDSNTKALLTTVASPSQDNSPIYIIALPNQHLDKLGPMNINELFSSIH